MGRILRSKMRTALVIRDLRAAREIKNVKKGVNL
jgi:hypothetical protein